MTAILTDNMRKNLADCFLAEVNDGTDSNQYYIGIGKSDTYPSDDTLVNPVRTLREQREARNNLQSVKKVSAASFVIPRYNWTSGTTYSGFTDTSVGIPTNSYYVMTEDNEVFICLQQSRNANGQAQPSTVKPAYSNQRLAFRTSDGYVWKFLYALSATKAASFLSAGYIPIEKAGTGGDTFQQQQKDIQDNAIAGQIIGVRIVSSGSGYVGDSATVTFSGNGSGALAKAKISGGAVARVEMINESAGYGSGYDYASAYISGNAVLQPIIGPVGGIGADPRNELKANAVMFNTKPSGEEGGTCVVDNDFRQIMLIKDPLISDSAAQFTETSGKALRYLTMTGSTAYSVDNRIFVDGTSKAAYVVDVDSTRVYYVQNENTGFTPFEDGDTVIDSDAVSGTINVADNKSIVDAHSGEVLYIENRARIIRSTAQTEDIKIIVQV